MTALLVPRTFQFATDSVEGASLFIPEKYDLVELPLHLLCEVNLKNLMKQKQLYWTRYYSRYSFQVISSCSPLLYTPSCQGCSQGCASISRSDDRH